VAFSTQKGLTMIRRETWYLLFVLAILLGLAFYLNRKQSAAHAQATPTSGLTYVFTSKDGIPSGIEITSSNGQTVRVVRNAQKIWEVELPFKTAANQALAEAAATQVGSLRVVDDIHGDPEIFGLDKPSYTIKVAFTGGKERKFQVGSKTPTGSGYYIRLDDQRMMIVSLSGLDALLNLATTPPYKETLTPSPTLPSETLVPRIEGTSMPIP
jgi:hypothetical protein